MNTVLEIQNVKFERKTSEINLTQKHVLQIQNANSGHKTVVKEGK
jgi:hypothetical protein